MNFVTWIEQLLGRALTPTQIALLEALPPKLPPASPRPIPTARPLRGHRASTAIIDEIGAIPERDQ